MSRMASDSSSDGNYKERVAYIHKWNTMVMFEQMAIVCIDHAFVRFRVFAGDAKQHGRMNKCIKNVADSKPRYSVTARASKSLPQRNFSSKLQAIANKVFK